VTFGLHVVEDVFNFAIGTDDEGCPSDAFDFLAVHILFFDHAKEIRNFLLGIRQEWKWQTEFVLKFLLRGRRISRNPKQDRARLFDCRVTVAKAAGFDCAAWSIGFRIEIKNYSLAAKIF